MAKFLTHKDRVNRFFDRVLPEPNSGCWLWTGEIRHDGYGECWSFGRRERAHQAAYREFIGELPAGLMIRHKCDNRCCCNPDHLEPGTQADNMRDKVVRGRHCRGETHGVAKLTDDEVRDIRAAQLTGRQLSAIYGISQVQVAKIKRLEAWGHVEGPTSVFIDTIIHRPRGDSHGQRKLTSVEVLEVRKSNLDQESLAEIYGVCQTTISKIRLRKTWKHLS